MGRLIRTQNRNAARKGLSDLTIYDKAVRKHISSSSEDNLELSDESLNNDLFNFADMLRTTDERRSQSKGRKSKPNSDDGPVALPPPRPHESHLTPEEEAHIHTRQAEGCKAHIYPTTGESLDQINSIVKIDQQYELVGSHIDQLTRERIIRGEYVDFGKLLPKDRILSEEDERLELVLKQGRAFWSPVSESITINSYNRWEQAFRIYSDIYTRHNPQRCPELIQYNHIIHYISSTYVWDNVYAYDKEFRMHISRHPERSWLVILQQAWSMRLKDRLSGANQLATGSGYDKRTGSNGNDNKSPKHKSTDACKRFNRGYCKFGASCIFEHKCLFCGKFGHTILTCRKLQAEKEWSSNRQKQGKSKRDE